MAKKRFENTCNPCKLSDKLIYCGEGLTDFLKAGATIYLTVKGN